MTFYMKSVMILNWLFELSMKKILISSRFLDFVVTVQFCFPQLDHVNVYLWILRNGAWCFSHALLYFIIYELYTERKIYTTKWVPVCYFFYGQKQWYCKFFIKCKWMQEKSSWGYTGTRKEHAVSPTQDLSFTCVFVCWILEGFVWIPMATFLPWTAGLQAGGCSRDSCSNSSCCPCCKDTFV